MPLNIVYMPGKGESPLTQLLIFSASHDQLILSISFLILGALVDFLLFWTNNLKSSFSINLKDLINALEPNSDSLSDKVSKLSSF